MGRKFEIKAEQEDWNKTGSWRNCDPYCIFFIYPWYGKPFIVKGGMNFCDEYLEKQKMLKALIVKSLWHEGKSRFTYARASNFLRKQGLTVYHNKAADGRKRFFFRFKGENILVTRRWPSQFPKQVKEKMRALRDV